MHHDNVSPFRGRPKLFRAWTVVGEKKHRGAVFRDVTFSWFVTDRERPVAPPNLLLKGYQSNRPPSDCWNEQDYAVADINECLTEDELAALTRYLRQAHNENLESKEVDLPAPILSESGAGVLPLGAIAVGGGTDFYMLSEESEYDLPVKIWGYFDVRDCEYEVVAEENTAPEGFPPWARTYGGFIVM